MAGRINTSMPDYVVAKLARALDERFHMGMNGACILLLGLAYKKNVDDLRESPSMRLIEKFERRGAMVDYHDRFIPVVPMTREHAALGGRESVAWDLDRFAGYDAILVATDHDGVDYAAVAQVAKVVVDTSNACARAGADMSRVVMA